jgi:hypothetical protein
MNIEAVMKTLDEQFVSIIDTIVTSYRDKEVETEFSYDIEECETFGEFFDLMIESEICEIYDLPYLTHVVLNDASNVCSHYPKLNP